MIEERKSKRKIYSLKQKCNWRKKKNSYSNVSSCRGHIVQYIKEATTKKNNYTYIYAYNLHKSLGIVERTECSGLWWHSKSRWTKALSTSGSSSIFICNVSPIAWASFSGKSSGSSISTFQHTYNNNLT